MRRSATWIPALLAAVGIALTASAQTSWTGDEDTAWANGNNWSAGTPGHAIFGATIPANQPVLTANAGASSITFEWTGWTIGGGTGYNLVPYNDFSSEGPGTNTINANLYFSGNSATTHTIHVGDGNTVNIAGGLSVAGVRTFTGSGTIIAGEGNFGLGDGANLGELKLFVSNPTTANTFSTIRFSSGGGIGGDGLFGCHGYNVWVPGAGAFVSPGADSTSIGTMTFQATYASAGVNLTGTEVIMDIGTSVGSSDRLVAGNALTRSNGLNLGGATLALRGTTVQDGDYTLLSKAGATPGTYTGTFGNVTFNGSSLDPSNYSLAYNANDVVLSLTGIPEPATLGLLAIGGLLALRRRRH